MSAERNDTGSGARLLPTIGVIALGAAIINLTIGAGIFALPADVAQQIGPHAWAAYVVCAVAMALVLLCFAVAGSRVTTTGGPYAYVHTAFGPFPAFVAGALLWVSAVASSAAVAAVFADILGTVVPVVATMVGRIAILLLIYGIAIFTNVRGAQSGVRTVTGFTLAKLIPLIALVLVAGVLLMLGHVPPPPAVHVAAGMTVSYPFTASAVGRTALVLIFAFTGAEVALAPSAEVRRPIRTVPLAIAGALCVVTLLYMSLQGVAQAVLGSALAQDPLIRAAPLSAVGMRLVGPVGGIVLTVAALVSTAGYVFGDVFASPRLLYALADDGHLPQALARVSARHGTPATAIILHGGLAAILAVSGTFATLAVLNNVALLVLYLMCCLAALVLLRRDRPETATASSGTPFTPPFGPLIPLLACVVLLWLLAHAEPREYAAVAVAIGIAVLGYFLGRRRSLHEEQVSGVW